MAPISRAEIEQVLATPVEGDTPSERNERRREAVLEFLSSRPSGSGLQGREHDMIMSDLESYRGWEYDEDGESARLQRPISTSRSYRPGYRRPGERSPG